MMAFHVMVLMLKSISHRIVCYDSLKFQHWSLIFFEEYSFGSDVCDKVTIHWWQIFQVDSRQYGTCLFFDVFCIKTEACHKDRHLPYWHYIPGQSLGVLLLQNMCFSCSNDGHFHQLHFSSSLILVECSYCHTILLRWCRS